MLRRGIFLNNYTYIYKNLQIIMLRIITLTLLLSFSFFQNFAQKGNPFIQNYLPYEYAGEDQVWSINQDQRGVMYFGSGDGLLKYNGVSWEKFYINEKRTAVLSSITGNDGLIYIGSVGEFGCMRPNEIGKLEYVSFVNELDSADRLFSNIWSIAKAGEYVYFAADEAIFRYNKNASPKVKKIYSKKQPFLLYNPNENVFISIRGGNLMKLEGDTLLTVYEKEKINPWFMLPFGKDKFLIGNYDNTLKVLDIGTTDSTKMLTKFLWFNKSEIKKTNKLLKENLLYTGACVLGNDKYAIGTITGGIFIINKDGKIVDNINKKEGLQSSTVHHLFVDKQNGLWTGLSYGVAKIEYSSPFRIFNNKSGIPGTIYDLFRFKDMVYASSNIGLYYYNGKQFTGVEALTEENSVQIFMPIVFPTNNKTDSILLITTISGMFSINGKLAEKINNISPDAIFQSESDNTKFYCSVDYDLYTFYYNGKEFSKPVVIHSFEGFVDSGIEISSSDVWLIIDGKPIIFNIKTSKISNFKDNKELSDVIIKEITDFEGQTLFLSNKGIFQFNKKAKIFYQDDSILTKEFTSHKTIQFSSVSKQLYWALLSEDKSTILKCSYNKDEKTYNNTPFKRLFNFNRIWADGDSLLWITSSKEIYKYYVNNTKTYIPKSAPVISKIKIAPDSVVFWGAYNFKFKNSLQNIKNVFKYNENNIVFEFALPEFENEKSNQFQYILEGKENSELSHWTNETNKEFSNLYEGKYTFKLKGRNVFQKETDFISFEFKILPPWYRAWWAYLLYLISLAIFIYIIIRLNARKLEKENIRLDNIVKERTAEMYLQKEEIQTQADNLEEINNKLNSTNEEISAIAENLKGANTKIRNKNIHITDSINYAKRIQKAILPTEREISEILDDFFIIDKPKDIVSGDFYFFKKFEQYIVISAADCTGHGVPGGFLSMMGVSFLNEIVHKKEIGSPAKALNLLRDKFKHSLRQKDYLSSRTDGIDIALCAIDTETGILEYAGANSPIYIIRENEVFELKPNLQPIGISFKEKPFTLQSFQLEIGDMLYMFSDGFQDQFGGNFNKKLLSRNLKKILIRFSKETVKIQRRNILRSFVSWKGENNQIDDVLLMGIRVTENMLGGKNKE